MSNDETTLLARAGAALVPLNLARRAIVDWRSAVAQFGASHAAARGCLLALARLAHADPGMGTGRLQWYAEAVGEVDRLRWQVRRGEGVERPGWAVSFGDTEFEALVEALEIAAAEIGT
jgi:hypothetical protein